MEEFQPGQVILPSGPNEPVTQPTGSPEPERPEERPTPTPTPAPAPETAEAATQPAAAITEPAPTPVENPLAAPKADWQFTQETPDSSLAAPEPTLPSELNWTASEFIAHEKGPSWYLVLALVGVAAAALIYLLTKDKVSTGVVVFAALALGVFAARKPRTQEYSMSGGGLQIGQKVYNFQDFKAFSVGEDGAIASIVFMPLKRFMPPLTIYVAPDMEDQVVNFLAAYLPFEQHKADAVDSLLRRIRF